MRVVEAEAKTLLIRRRRVDSWFMSAVGMNLYRGCSHDCAYCDGRAEQYYVSGEFGSEVVAKTNAPALRRMPTRFFRGVLGENDKVAVLLEGLDYLRRLGGCRSFLWRAARTIAERPRPISEDRYQLGRLPGLGGEPARIVEEILTTGTAAEYEERLRGAA